MHFLSKTMEIFRNMGWANRITTMRIIAAVPIILLIHFPNLFSCWIAALLFIAASISDFLDGYIARKSKQVTNFGKFLDPLADKLLICAVLVEMTGLGWVPAWIVNLIIARELAVTGLRAIAAAQGVVIAADRFGKWKTVFQIIALVPLLIHFPFWGIPVHTLGTLLLYVALFLTVFSGCNYFRLFYKDWHGTTLS